MIKRRIYNEIIETLQQFPVIGILGSRQVGKTTLAKEIQKQFQPSIYVDLELPSDFSKLNDAELFLSSYQDNLIIIDEIQHKLELFQIIRALVDKNRKPGRFIILGSASPELVKKSSESLAGRIYYHYLNPFSIDEVGFDSKLIDDLWLRGGYPNSFLAIDEKQSFKWREAFVTTFLERDIPKFGVRIPFTQLRRFWTMIAHLHGSLWNASKVALSLGVTPPTSKSYLDILEGTFIVRQLQPFFTNVKKRLVKSPKIFLRDSGILHSLLNLENRDELLSHPIVGHSWEGFVIEQIINNLPPGYGSYFYRTSAGAEIDLVITKGNKPILCLDVKLSLSPQVSAGFSNAIDDLKCDKGFVVYPGKDIYPIKKNIRAVPISKIDEITRF
jgi:predicted AAA+ superfamily ATPase